MSEGMAEGYYHGIRHPRETEGGYRPDIAGVAPSAPPRLILSQPSSVQAPLARHPVPPGSGGGGTVYMPSGGGDAHISDAPGPRDGYGMSHAGGAAIAATGPGAPGPAPRGPEQGVDMGRRKPAVRLEVRRLSLLMELKLRRNDHKGGWQHMTPMELLERLEGEVRELRQAIYEGDPLDIAQECADVANYAMMIADVTEGI